MTMQNVLSVGDVTSFGDEWVFALHYAADRAPILFAFKSRKEANVSRRLMKEIVARTSTAMKPAYSQPPFQDVDRQDQHPQNQV